MDVTLPTDIEAIAMQAVSRGDYNSVADFIAAAVRNSSIFEELLQEKENRGQVPAYKLPYPEWKKRFDEFLSRQKSTNPNFDDSRESMYPDRI